jgi:hypothetical protein
VGSEYTKNNWFSAFEETIAPECSVSLCAILVFDKLTVDE